MASNILKQPSWMQSYQPQQQQAQTGNSFGALQQAYKPAAQPAADTEPSWMDKLTSYSKDPGAAKTEYQRATQVFNAKSAIGDTTGAAAADKYRGQVQTASGGLAAPNPNDELQPWMKAYTDYLQKPTTPFKYDAESDPAYQAARRTAQTNSQQAAGNIAADMNKRGLLNSTITADRGNQAAQAEYSRVSDTILPQLRSESYKQYQDAQQQDRYKNEDIMKYITTRYGMNQDDIVNKRTDTQNAFTNNLATRQDARAEGQMTGSYMPPGAKDSISAILALKQQAEQSGTTPEQMTQLKAAADGERNKLYQMGVDPSIVGFDNNYDQASKNAAGYRGIPTLQAQGQNFNQNLQTHDQALQETQVNAQLTGKLPDGTPTYAAGQESLRNTAQYAGMYNGQPTMQKIMQDANISNMTSDNTRAAAAEARAAGNNQLAKRMEIWDRTGKAPAGIPGVPEGTPLGGKKSTALTAENYSKFLDGVAKYETDPDTKAKKLTNAQAVEDAILLSGADDYEQYKMYNRMGIPWTDPIPKAPGKP